MCFPAPPRRYTECDTSPLRIQCEEGRTGYVQFSEATKYLGFVIHYDLDTRDAVEARISKASQVLGSLRQVQQCRYVAAPVRGKILLATVVNTLLYGSESWVLTTETRRMLTTFYNDCCRYALGYSRSRAMVEGIHNTDLHTLLQIQPLDYYLRHRRLCWAGRLARMGMHRLPRRLLTSQAVVGASEVVEVAASPNTDSARTEMPVLETAEHCSSSDEAGQESDESEAWQGGDESDSASSDTNSGGSADAAQAEGEGQVRRSVEYAVSSRSSCRATRQRIMKGSVRFKVVTPARRRGGKAIAHHLSLAGMVQVMARKKGLRHRLRRSLAGLEELRGGDRRAVQRALSGSTVRAVRRSLAPSPITPPQHMPWTCPRCGKTYRSRAQDAIRHAIRDQCSMRRRRRTKPPKVRPHSRLEEGKKRRTTWRSNVHELLRRTSSISQQGCSVCRKCRRYAQQCERCYFLEWMSVAQDSKRWDKLVYGTTEGSGVVSARRRMKRQESEEEWEDPRVAEARRKGVRPLREVAAVRWPTAGQAVGAMRILTARAPHLDVARVCTVCAAVLHHEPNNEDALRWLNSLSFNRYARAVLMEVAAERPAVG